MSELDRLAADLGRASIKVATGAVAMVHRGSNNVVRDAKKLSSGMSHAPHYPDSIGYDVKVSAGSIGAEIGPDKDKRQGALGNLLEYGSVNNPPHSHLGPALDREGPKFMDAAADLGEDIL